MRRILNTTALFVLIALGAGCGERSTPSPGAELAPEVADVAAVATDQEMEVELGCAMCIYNKDGIDRCLTAAKIGENVLMVDSDLDAHSAGLCKGAKTGTVMAHIDGDRLVASKITLN